LQAAAAEIADVLADERIVPPPARAAIGRFLDELGATDIYELQERYFALFDRTAPSRCTCSSTCTARAAIAVRRWPT
jgi:nitrate reductase assembly molybdenum cofactor insertion protein NarJ